MHIVQLISDWRLKLYSCSFWVNLYHTVVLGKLVPKYLFWIAITDYFFSCTSLSCSYIVFGVCFQLVSFHLVSNKNLICISDSNCSCINREIVVWSHFVLMRIKMLLSSFDSGKMWIIFMAKSVVNVHSSIFPYPPQVELEYLTDME